MTMTTSERSEELHAAAAPTKRVLDREAVTRIYERWAPVYDLVFGPLFDRGRQAAIDAAARIGGRVLDVGVGTGIALPHYGRSASVVGVDLSAPMLRKAEARVAALGLRNVAGLAVMDAARLAFADASFDVVVAQYVVNTVPDPEATLDEFARVLKPGGEIVLLNRVGADTGPRRTVERWLMPVVSRLGWRTEFPWARFASWAERAHGMHLVERRAMPPFGHFALIRFGKAARRPRAALRRAAG
jgi:phosphatidylethanolamine/phosphatidyl-N-methylethanolamine N-methyltransferase